MLSNHISEQWKGGKHVKLPDLKKLFAKKEEPMETPMPSKPLPDDLEKFRMERTEPKPIGATVTPTFAEERYGTIPEKTPVLVAEPTPTPAPAVSGDRIDMILQKLETIDTRLKLIEERMK